MPMFGVWSRMAGDAARRDVGHCSESRLSGRLNTKEARRLAGLTSIRAVWSGRWYRTHDPLLGKPLVHRSWPTEGEIARPALRARGDARATFYLPIRE